MTERELHSLQTNWLELVDFTEHLLQSGRALAQETQVLTDVFKAYWLLHLAQVAVLVAEV